MRQRFVQECIAWLRTLASAAMYATLLITFVGQVIRPAKLPTAEDMYRAWNNGVEVDPY